MGRRNARTAQLPVPGEPLRSLPSPLVQHVTDTAGAHLHEDCGGLHAQAGAGRDAVGHVLQAASSCARHHVVLRAADLGVGNLGISFLPRLAACAAGLGSAPAGRRQGRPEMPKTAATGRGADPNPDAANGLGDRAGVSETPNPRS